MRYMNEMNDQLADYFFFFLLRDHLPAGAIAEALQDAEKSLAQEVIKDTLITEGMLNLASKFTDRFFVKQI